MFPTPAGPNLALKGMLSTLYGSSTPVNFASWMGFAVPIMLVNLVIMMLARTIMPVMGIVLPILGAVLGVVQVALGLQIIHNALTTMGVL